MKKPLSIAALLLVFLVSGSSVTVSIAEAQVAGSAQDLAADEEGNLIGPPPPSYKVEEDGTLVIDGDMAIGGYCRNFSANPKQTLPKHKEYAEACERAGLSPSAGKSAALPETGGVNVAVFVFASSVLAGSIMARATAR